MHASKRLAVAAATTAIVSAVLSSPVASATTDPGQASHTRPAAASRCGGNLPATPYKWTTSKGNCSVFGYPGFQLGVRWNVYGNQRAALQVMGFDSHGKRHWYKCGSGGGYCKAPWGNGAAAPRVRAWNPTGISHIYWNVG
ncbi:hypothetical protein [Streptomyces sp. NPDC046759]|uniref:hypothetical protein n=1 Tax=Streptomyces sp. NPDC046759 TaxID=3155019 RepID=UPI0033CF8798